MPGVTFGQQGQVTLGQGFRELEVAWLTGIAAMARAGARIFVGHVFLGDATSQERARQHLGGLEVLWVGVRCDPAVAAGRELARGSRVIGMAVSQGDGGAQRGCSMPATSAWARVSHARTTPCLRSRPLRVLPLCTQATVQPSHRRCPSADLPRRRMYHRASPRRSRRADTARPACSLGTGNNYV